MIKGQPKAVKQSTKETVETLKTVVQNMGETVVGMRQHVHNLAESFQKSQLANNARSAVFERHLAQLTNTESEAIVKEIEDEYAQRVEEYNKEIDRQLQEMQKQYEEAARANAGESEEVVEVETPVEVVEVNLSEPKGEEVLSTQ